MQQNMRRHGYYGGVGGGLGDDKVFVWFMGIVIAVVIAFFGWVAYACHEDAKYDKLPNKVYTKQMGTLLAVHDCWSSKGSYNCEVVLSTGERFETNVTGWPDDILNLGQPLHIELWTQGDRQRGMWCNRTKCTERWRTYRGHSDFKTY